MSTIILRDHRVAAGAYDALLKPSFRTPTWKKLHNSHLGMLLWNMVSLVSFLPILISFVVLFVFMEVKGHFYLTKSGGSGASRRKLRGPVVAVLELPLSLQASRRRYFFLYQPLIREFVYDY